MQISRDAAITSRRGALHLPWCSLKGFNRLFRALVYLVPAGEPVSDAPRIYSESIGQRRLPTLAVQVLADGAEFIGGHAVAELLCCCASKVRRDWYLKVFGHR